MSISSSLYRLLISLIFVLGVAACHDEATAPTNVPREISLPGPALRSAAIPGYAVATADEQIAAEYLARTLALSLARADLRLEVKMAIATSMMKDHKLHFASFLQGRGGRIVAAMEEQDRSILVGVQSAVGRVRDLEFYMPVPAHREKWTGGEDLLVGVGLSETDSPIAFNTRGERIILSATVPPHTPTLFLVPNETDLSAQIALNRQGRAAVTCLPVATESLEATGARCTRTPNLTLTSSAGFVPTVRSSAIAPPSAVSKSFGSDPQIIGLHAEFLRLLDDGEPYWMQPPEIEIHIVAKRSREGGELNDYQCSGEHAASFSHSQPGVRDPAYVFDQNDHFWDGSARPVLLLNSWQMDEIQRDEREGYLITVWEDDNEACAIREDAGVSLQTLIDDLKNVLPGSKVAVKVSSISPGTAIAIGVIVYSVARLLAGGDDLLGVLTDKRETPYANTYPDNTHVLLRENGDLRGRATLNVISTGRYASVSGPTQASPGQQAYFSASAAGTFGALTHTFTASGPDGNGPSVIQSGPASGVYYSNSNQGTYSIGVNITDSYGSVGESSTLLTIPPGPPPVTASTVNGRPRLSWGAVPGAATYRIYRQLEWQQQAEIWNTVSGTVYDDPSTNVSGPPQSNPPKGQWAKYYVVSVSANGIEGTYSSVHYYPYGGIAPY